MMDLTTISLVIAVLATLVSVGSVLFALKSRRRITPDRYGVRDLPKPRQYCGLIMFAGLQQRAHLERAIQYHGDKLKSVWLITTEGSREVASTIQSAYQTLGRKVSIVPLDDPLDLRSAKAIVEEIYREHLDTLDEEDVIADFTGGTKPMTVGMIFACLSPSRHLEYVPARYGPDGQLEPLDPIEYFLEIPNLLKSSLKP